MDVLENLVDGLQGFLAGFNRNMGEVTREISGEITAMNVEQLYGRGETREGKPVEPPYAASTIQIKRAKGQRTDHVTLRDTGDFHASFRVDETQDGFGITATDRKTGLLESKYGEEILGLQDGNVQELAERYYLPRMREKLLEAIKH